MIKVTTGDVIRQLVSRGVFEWKKDAEYQIGIKDEQIVVNKDGSAEIAYRRQIGWLQLCVQK